MRLVRQRGDHDCGVAAAAMVSGWPYRSVLRVALGADCYRHEGLSVPNMRALLEALTGLEWEPATVKPYPRLGEADLDHGQVLLIQDPEKGFGHNHWVVADGCRILDPERPRPMAPWRHDRRLWPVIRTLTPRAAASAGRAAI